ncbi:MAG: hypothetical protein M5U34_47610 [Chloroflexi bacterium]|nr:hypothetical protein [Chloroflexota bacterium]
MEDKMQPVTQVNGAVSEPMSAALLQAMSLNPSQRYQSVDDFVHSLQQPNPTAKPENTAASQPPPIKENNLTVGTSQPSGSGIKPIWWVLGTAVLLLAVFFVFILPMTRQQAAQELALQITRQASGTRIAATSTAEYEGTETAVAEKITTRNDTIATLEAQATKVFGPSNGTLWHEENNLVKEVSAGVSLKNFIVWTKFTNPYSPDINSWDYGFVFRDDDSNKQFRLIIRSDQTWTLIQRKGDSSEFIASGSIPDLQVSANQRNKIKLIGHDNQGWLFVNDDFITELDLSSSHQFG